MQTVFNCCHGMFEPKAGNWICSTQGTEGGGLVDEEIIGDESPAYNPHLQPGEQPGGHFPGGSGNHRGVPQAPLAHGEEEKESAKVKLQRLIRDFAHDAVGPGLEIEAQSDALEGLAGCTPGLGGSLQALLRMDRRLSRLELWPPNTSDGIVHGTSATYAVPLQQVASIAKGIATPGSEEADSTRDSSTLTVMQRNGPDLRLLFDSNNTRERAYTCLRIFQMSVDQGGMEPNNSREQTLQEGSELDRTAEFDDEKVE